MVTYDDPHEVARIPVGDHPQRVRMLPMIVPDLQLEVQKPKRARKGERRRVRVRVTWAAPASSRAPRAPVARSRELTIQIGKKTATTNADGVAKIRVKFRRRGKLAISADATGYAGDDASLRVRRPR